MAGSRRAGPERVHKAEGRRVREVPTRTHHLAAHAACHAARRRDSRRQRTIYSMVRVSCSMRHAPSQILRDQNAALDRLTPLDKVVRRSLFCIYRCYTRSHFKRVVARRGRPSRCSTSQTSNVQQELRQLFSPTATRRPTRDAVWEHAEPTCAVARPPARPGPMGSALTKVLVCSPCRTLPKARGAHKEYHASDEPLLSPVRNNPKAGGKAKHVEQLQIVDLEDDDVHEENTSSPRRIIDFIQTDPATIEVRFDRGNKWTETNYRRLGEALRSCGALQVLVLTRMNMKDADAVALLEALPFPESLQVLDLGFCESLTTLPDLSKLTSLQRLGLYGCTSLASLPDVSGLKDLANVTRPIHLSGAASSSELDKPPPTANAADARVRRHYERQIAALEQQLADSLAAQQSMQAQLSQARIAAGIISQTAGAYGIKDIGSATDLDATRMQALMGFRDARRSVSAKWQNTPIAPARSFMKPTRSAASRAMLEASLR